MKAAEVPVSAALEDSFSGLDKDLAGDAAKLMSVDASSSANAFDTAPKLDKLENFEESFGEKEAKEPSLADKIKAAKEE